VEVNVMVQASGLTSFVPALTQGFSNDACNDSLLRKKSLFKLTQMSKIH